MKLLSKRYILTLLCGSLALQGAIQAESNLEARLLSVTQKQTQDQDDKEEEQEKQELIQIGTRQIAHAEYLVLQESRQHQMESETAIDQLVANANDLIPLENKGKLASKATFYTSHAGALHSPYYVSLFGDYVRIEDGSEWLVRLSDTYKVLNWIPTDTVVISPNPDIYSSYHYRMTNQNTGVSVDADIKGPYYSNELYTYRITALDKIFNKVYLNDGSVWDMTSFDKNVFYNWLPSDVIIMGINTDAFCDTRPNILINVNTLSYARGICIH